MHQRYKNKNEVKPTYKDTTLLSEIEKKALILIGSLVHACKILPAHKAMDSFNFTKMFQCLCSQKVATGVNPALTLSK